MVQYEILGRVASTRSGGVWRARDVGLDRVVALKEIASTQEAAALAALHSPHVVAVYGVVEDAGRTFLVEEWVDAATLAAVLRSAGRLSREQALGVLRGALLGLADVHRAGLVHGDVSASNILVDGAGAARLIDFGSVVRAGERAGAATGAFAAPEVRAGATVTPATDVYAAAAVLAMLLHGRTETAPSTRGVEEPVKGVLDRALADDPAQRYRDAAAFLAALEDAGQRRYGAAWWTQAGFGALVAPAVASLVEAGPDAPFTGRGHAAAAERPAEPAAPLGAVAESPVRHAARRRRVLLGTGAAVLAIGAAVLAVAVSSGGSEKPSGAPAAVTSTPGTDTAIQTTSATTSTTSSTPPGSAATGFAGSYVIRQVVVSTSGLSPREADFRVGNRTTRRWRVTVSCAATCIAHVTITDGGSIPAVTLRRTATGWRGTAHFEGPCLSGTNGAVIGTVPRTVVYTVLAPDPAAGRFTGRAVDTGPAAAGCPAVRVVKTLALSRR